jgi:Fe-S oxidoreductase
MPSVVNALTRTPLVSDVFKRLGGIAPAREIPRLAPETFRAWFRRRRAAPRTSSTTVLLWPDTFTNHFFPEIGRAAVEVLEDAGSRVILPPRVLCCGRPLYDFGMLDLAKGMLRQILDILRPQIRAGVPVVGLEPSCVAVFRDEMCNLFPHDQDALRLREQVFTLAEFLERAEYAPPPLSRRALVQGHCHHKSVMTLTADEHVLDRLGLDYEILDAGCCGMAGSFGFERSHYDVSLAVGERALLPRVRAADASTLIVADGFSCREQIAQTTGRRALHLAEVLQLALRANGRPSLHDVNGHQLTATRVNVRRVALFGVGAALGAAAVLWGRERQ